MSCLAKNYATHVRRTLSMHPSLAPVMRQHFNDQALICPFLLADVDISLPVRRRRRELREYGFECDCARCVRELAAVKSTPKSSNGKKRLK